MQSDVSDTATNVSFSSAAYWKYDWIHEMNLNEYTTTAVANANRQIKDNNVIMRARDYSKPNKNF